MAKDRAVIPQPTTTSVGGVPVGLYEFGDPSGRPVLTFHGIPACGAGFEFADEPARDRGLRVIAPDRPGVGLSARAEGWTVGAYPAMVTDLADALGLDRFAVWGYSGGGPYAVAVAASLADRVTRAAICAGMGEVGTFASDDDFEKTDRQLLAMARKRPGIARAVLAASARLARLSPGSAVKSFRKQLTESDSAVIDGYDSPREAMALYTQAFLRGARGVVDDYRSVGQPWGVDLSSVTVPVRIYQGDADTMVPPRHAEELQRRIPGAELVRWPGEGHLATIAHVGEVLDWLAG